MSQITRVVTEADHDMALARISELPDAELNSPEGEELDRLSTLVEAYEAEHYPIEFFLKTPAHPASAAVSD